MHILYMHQHFQTRRGITGNRSYEFSKCLIRRGHRITMICSGVENEPRLTVPPGKKYIETEVDGIHCVPIAAALANPLIVTRLSGYRRMLQFLHFAKLASRVGRRLPRPDIVFASHTPLTIGLAGMDLARHFDVPFVFEVRDLWPQALINLGVLRNRLAIWWMRRMERKIYRAADHIVALSPGMKQGVVAAGIAERHVTMIPNACDLDLFRPDIDPGPGRERLKLGDRFAAIYFGGMGVANGLDYAVEAARELHRRGNERIVIVLHGNGGQRKALQSQVRQYGLPNVVFSDPVPDKAKVAQLVAACDVCLTIYRATTEHTWSPNKMFDSLAAGKPVLINVPGWLTDVVEQHRCGRGVSPERPEQLADALEDLAAAPDQCRRMGENARALAQRQFARERLAQELETVLQREIDGRAAPAAPPTSVTSPAP